MSGFDASRDRAVIGAIAQVASGYIHEINNKLGPILLNAETLALSSQDASDAAKDIARNVQDLLDMMRDIEAVLPRNLESGMSVGEMVHLAERLGRGALHRRRLKMVLPEFDASRLVETERLATFIAMLLVPLVFHGPKEGGPGTMTVDFLDRPASSTWRIEVEPPVPPDEEILKSLSDICIGNRWTLTSGPGLLSIVVERNG